MASRDDGDPDVPIVCPACETRTRVPLPDVRATIDRHNDQLHDGEEIAAVDPALKAQLADLVASDLGLTDSRD